MKTRVAFYARFSTSLQDATSIDGQFRNCEALAVDYNVVARYEDKALSGTDENRPGYRALLAAAEAGEFDGVIVDETSRLTRNPWELPRLIEEFAYRGQFLLARGFDSRHETAQLMAGIYGGLDRMELQKIRSRTHRGLRERASSGFSAGGKTYGYQSEAIDPADPDTRWRKVVDPDTAPVVVDIFEMYADGMGGKAIAAELNRRGVPSPGASWNRTSRRTDGKWQHSAILGMASRGNGILRNELYIGKVIWNRCEWVKKPGTGKRTYRLRPESEWIVEDHPELRIVPQPLWDRVQARLANTRKIKPGRRGTYLLTGILKCMDCGGSLTMIDARCYGCGTRHRGGDAACDNPVRIKRAVLEEQFLAGVRDVLLDRSTVQYAEREIARRLAAPRGASEALRQELTTVEAELRRVADAIAQIGVSDTLAAKLAELESRKRQLASQVDEAERVIEMPDAAAITAAWKALVNDLGSLPARATPPELASARSALAACFGEVRVDREGKGYADLSIGVPTRMVAGARCGTLQVVFNLAA